MGLSDRSDEMGLSDRSDAIGLTGSRESGIETEGRTRSKLGARENTENAAKINRMILSPRVVRRLTVRAGATTKNIDAVQVAWFGSGRLGGARGTVPS